MALDEVLILARRSCAVIPVTVLDRQQGLLVIGVEQRRIGWRTLASTDGLRTLVELFGICSNPSTHTGNTTKPVRMAKFKDVTAVVFIASIMSDRFGNVYLLIHTPAWGKFTLRLTVGEGLRITPLPARPVLDPPKAHHGVHGGPVSADLGTISRSRHRIPFHSGQTRS